MKVLLALTSLFCTSVLWAAVENGGQIRNVSFERGGASLPIDRLVIREVVQKNRGDVRSCYERELLKNKNLHGKVIVEWDVDSQGTVRRIDMKKTTLKNYRVERCLASKIMNWNFPAAPAGHISRVTYPFEFSVLEQ